jgi:hypothetical protein
MVFPNLTRHFAKALALFCVTLVRGGVGIARSSWRSCLLANNQSAQEATQQQETSPAKECGHENLTVEKLESEGLSMS